jgi:thioredoxin-like negative regulator of GroEL
LVRFLQKAASLLPEEPSIQLHLAQAYKAAGRYDEAIASLTAIREKGASTSELKTAEALLKEMN